MSITHSVRYASGYLLTSIYCESDLLSGGIEEPALSERYLLGSSSHRYFASRFKGRSATCVRQSLKPHWQRRTKTAASEGILAIPYTISGSLFLFMVIYLYEIKSAHNDVDSLTSMKSSAQSERVCGRNQGS